MNTTKTKKTIESKGTVKNTRIKEAYKIFNPTTSGLTCRCSSNWELLAVSRFKMNKNCVLLFFHHHMLGKNNNYPRVSKSQVSRRFYCKHVCIVPMGILVSLFVVRVLILDQTLKGSPSFWPIYRNGLEGTVNTQEMSLMLYTTECPKRSISTRKDGPG